MVRIIILSILFTINIVAIYFTVRELLQHIRIMRILGDYGDDYGEGIE